MMIVNIGQLSKELRNIEDQNGKRLGQPKTGFSLGDDS